MPNENARHVPGPNENPLAWDQLCFYDGQRHYTPGVATVKVRAGGRREAETQPFGTNGTVKTFLGYKDAEAQVTIRLWNDKQFAALKKIIELYRNKRGDREAKPIQCIHPQLVLYGISSVFVSDIEADDYDPETGYVVVFNLREFQSTSRDSKTGAQNVGNRKGRVGKNGTGSGSGSGSSGLGTGDAPIDATATNPTKTTTSQNTRANPPSTQKIGGFARGFAAGSNQVSSLFGGVGR